MARYDYKCDNCGDVFEVTMRFSEVGKEVFCPKCNTQARRYIQVKGVLVQFVGEGFASNDLKDRNLPPDPLAGYES